jgi:hypothetical protein
MVGFQPADFGTPHDFLWLDVGGRGAWFTTSKYGNRVTIGLPGSGLRWTDYQPEARAARP